MQVREQRAVKQKHAPVNLSVRASAATLFLTSVQRLTEAHGLSFFALQRRGIAVRCRALTDLLPASSMEDVLKQGALEMQRSLATLRQPAEEWSRRWRCPHAEQEQGTQCLTQLALPSALLRLLPDMGITKASEPFSVVGGLPPAMEFWEGCPRNSACLAASSPSLHPLTTICINAIESITEITEDLPLESRVAAAKHALSRQREKKIIYSEQGDGEDNTAKNDASDTTGRRDPAQEPTVRLFLFSPYASYAALYEAVNKSNDSESLFFGGEACEVLLVYICPMTAAGSVGPTTLNDNPEIWGRLRYQQAGDAESATPGNRRGNHDELFFIAATLGDYLRLGSAFSWVYGWQLCYAPQGPPPRSLPWLKLFSPTALSAAISTSL
ncbi:hypothetical protein TcYC6_0026700 [Trypanosoma cruzi]|uniref:Uncharacterized protein n=1 Tax=Trypanosoma cruzi (strain CL Brener) TaxID=353153 RepID=Q4CUX7_TRYCC|nr:hypothetical protein, conserved [Trypanosoma cruzi]EAN84080.1 hypothetical protein, conserved [Trypanosoma cruzi]KAF8284610.1 hypothetical protein TcYC6_0026700 [Trypanosoma cruzi]RNC53882.1 hypothetical protein TcCL_ESM08748 [Trypanosoma cruzi]|eukprot:XP_805931.1 hypothetical protein [Trypanosoma cruzi strain CL Brener]